MSENRDEVLDYRSSLQAVAGILASGVTGELAQPLRQLRESLAVMVATLDHHIGESEGPTPYPWRSTQDLRQEITRAYLLSRETARLAGELYTAVTMNDGELDDVDINKQVEVAVELVRHRFGEAIDLFVDLGSIPSIRAVSGELCLAIAKLILCCEDSARGRDGSAISVRTHLDQTEIASGDDGGDTGDRPVSEVVVYVADNGAGSPASAESARRTLQPLMHGLGGSFDGISEPGRGSVYECRIPVPGR